MGSLYLDPALTAMLFEGNALIYIFEQILVFLVYVGRLAVIHQPSAIGPSGNSKCR